MSISSSHDKFFRTSLAHPKVAKELLMQHLPSDIQKIINWKSLKLCKETYIDEDLSKKMVDVLFKVNLKDQPGYIYLLTEHQSTAELFMPLRIIEYTVRILNDHLKKYPNTKTLPLVIPLVFYNGERCYTYPTDIFDLFEHKALAEAYMFGAFQLVDLNKIADEALKDHIWAGTLQFFLKHAREREFKNEEGVFYLKELQLQDGMVYVRETLHYLYGIRNIEERAKFDKILKENLAEEGEKTMTTIAEYLRQEGAVKGKQEGLMQGRQEGLAQGIGKGLAQGIEKGKQEVARNLLNNGFSIAKVIELTGLSLNEIKQSKLDEEIVK